jgi:hypothetical protein
MTKQTAVEWLIEQLRNEEGIDFIPTSFVKKAKEMDKQQKIDAMTFCNPLFSRLVFVFL